MEGKHCVYVHCSKKLDIKRAFHVLQEGGSYLNLLYKREDKEDRFSKPDYFSQENLDTDARVFSGCIEYKDTPVDFELVKLEVVKMSFSEDWKEIKYYEQKCTFKDGTEETEVEKSEDFDEECVAEFYKTL